MTIDDLKTELSAVYREVFFRAPDVSPLPPLFETGADRAGIRVNDRMAVYEVDTSEDFADPLFRVILSANLPDYIFDVAVCLNHDRRAYGTMLLSAAELIRLVILAESAHIAEQVMTDRQDAVS